MCIVCEGTNEVSYTCIFPLAIMVQTFTLPCTGHITTIVLNVHKSVLCFFKLQNFSWPDMQTLHYLPGHVSPLCVSIIICHCLCLVDLVASPSILKLLGHISSECMIVYRYAWEVNHLTAIFSENRSAKT